MCGIFGVWNVRKAAEWTAVGLHNLNHRAIEYAGIVSFDGTHFYRESGSGVARQVFTREVADRLHGKIALGHIRYSTVVDDKDRDNTQPIMGIWNSVPFAVAHNGNLTNTDELRSLLPAIKFSTSMDTEFIVRLLESRSSGDFDKDLLEVLPLLRGSFSLGILLPERLIAVRDPQGNRPLSVGTVDDGYCISSENGIFPNVRAKHLGDIEPGTLVSISRQGLVTMRFALPDPQHCRFESIYFSHPASRVFDEEVTQFRLKLGRVLEECFPVADADIVTPIPDSSNFIAQGYAESGRSGKYLPVISRSHYAGRSFIAPTQRKREAEVAQKFAFTAGEIKGKRLVVVDDSIVRGTTLEEIVRKLRSLDAREIHVRIGSPPNKHPCRYGINTATYEELVAARCSVEEICAQSGADSLEFLPLEELKKLSSNPTQFCYACMDGKYW